MFNERKIQPGFFKVWNIILQKSYHLLLQVLHLSDVFIVYINGKKHLIIKSESEVSTKKTWNHRNGNIIVNFS